VRALDVRVGRRRRGLAEPLADLVERLTRRAPVVVVDAGAVTRAAVAAEACDALVLVGGAGEAPRTRLPAHTPVHRVVNLYGGGEPPPIVWSEPYVIRTDVSLVGLDAVAQARRLAADRRSPAAPPLRRLARKLLGRSVGLALGGGAAFGVAHVGVLLALEEHGIEVDVLTGSSIGSIAALSYASGMRPEEMLAITRRIGHWRTTLSVVDPTVTRPGLLAGERLKAIFRPFLGAAETFEDLVLPCQTVATDIETGQRVDIASGPLIDAFRASGSVPMLWSPVREDGRTLVDGAIIDPVPSDLAYEIGADVCIAVNVVPTLRPGVETVLTRASRWANALNPFSHLSDTREMPNILDVGMNALQIVAYELGSFKARDADVLLNVDASDYTWVDFHRAEGLVERGVETVERSLPAIREAVGVRPVLPG
jgi:NTE family protein